MGVAAPFIILVVLFFLVAPILGVVAFVRLARLEGRRRSGRNESVVGRVSALERQVSELSRRLQEVLKTTEPEGPPAEHLAAPKSEGTAMAVEPSLCPSLQVPPPSTQATHSPADAVQIKPGAGGLDMETRFAGRWLNWIAIVALLPSCPKIQMRCQALDGCALGPGATCSNGFTELTAAAFTPPFTRISKVSGLKGPPSAGGGTADHG